MILKKAERERLDGFMLTLNDSGFPNPEIARQVGRSLSFVEKALNGKKGFIWRLPSSPPVTRRWRGGTERSSMELKRLKLAIGRNLFWLWSVVDEPVQTARRGPGRPATVRPFRVIVERAVSVLALVCGVSQAEPWRWIRPGRSRHIHRHTRR